MSRWGRLEIILKFYMLRMFRESAENAWKSANRFSTQAKMNSIHELEKAEATEGA